MDGPPCCSGSSHSRSTETPPGACTSCSARPSPVHFRIRCAHTSPRVPTSCRRPRALRRVAVWPCERAGHGTAAGDTVMQGRPGLCAGDRACAHVGVPVLQQSWSLGAPPGPPFSVTAPSPVTRSREGAPWVLLFPGGPPSRTRGESSAGRREQHGPGLTVPPPRTSDVGHVPVPGGASRLVTRDPWPPWPP